MSETNVLEVIKYLTEDELKLMYGRLNRRYKLVDELPDMDSLEPADKNVIYVVKETVGKTVRYWPNVIDGDEWKPVGISQDVLDGKLDRVNAPEGHLVVSGENGDLVDADIMPGTFVALAIDPSERIQPHATDLRKIWKAYQSGMPVILLDNRPDGSGLYAQLNAAGYTWADGNHMAEYLADVDDDNRQCDGTIHGYCTELDGVVKFYEDDGHTVEIIPENGKLYCDDTVPDHDRVYLYNDGFVRALRFVQFSCNELIDDDPAWPSRRANRQVFYRMTEPYGSSSPDGFEVAYGESTADIHDQMVTGARIGEGKLLPVDDGVIVLPKSTAVNDGTLTITVGENEPVVFSANDSADRTVDIPVATDEVAGLVRITSDVDSDDPDAAITATAVLDELDSYVQKVDGATAGHIAVLTPEGSLSDSGISSTDVESVIGHDHTHSNKGILDNITAAYTAGEQEKLGNVEAGAEVNLIDTVEVDGSALVITGKTVNIPGATASVKGVVLLTDDPESDAANTAATPTAIRAALANFGGFMVVELDPETGKPDVEKPSTKYIYLTKEDESGKEDPYTEWIYVAPEQGEPRWDIIGTASVDLSNYYTKSEVDTALGDKVDKVTGKGLSTNDYTTEDKNKLTGIESGAQVNIIESVKVAGSALAIDSKSVNVPEAGGTAGAWVKGVVSGEDTARWDNWKVGVFPIIPSNIVVIGGREYPTVQIGNQIWMAENLDWKWTGLTIGSSSPSTTNQQANYFNYDESTYGVNGNKYGLMYNYPAVKHLVDNTSTMLPEGWHVPTSTDWTTLATNPNVNADSSNLKSKTGWSTGNGNNSTGFNAYPSGETTAIINGQVYAYWSRELGTNCYYFSNSATSLGKPFVFSLNTTNNIYTSGEREADCLYNIRLVKNLT